MNALELIIEKNWDDKIVTGKELENAVAELVCLKDKEQALEKWKESIDFFPDKNCSCADCKLYFSIWDE